MSLTLQFVDRISATPTLRLNLNAAPWKTLSDTKFGMPEMRQAQTTTLLVDGGTVGASALGFRVLSLRLQVKTASVDETATEIQKLVRELNRERNLLMTMMGTKPVFFRTFRSAPDSWDIHTDGSFCNISADILAMPHADGLLESATLSGGGVVDTNPANSNGNFVDVTGVIGDADTPAIIRWPATAVAAGRETLFATRRKGTPSAAPFLFQAEAMTLGVDATLPGNDAAMSGAGSNYARISFATASMQNRISLTDVGTAGVDLRGRYRVFARIRRSSATGTINVAVRWGISFSGETTFNDSVATAESTALGMIDLGEIQIPRGEDPVTADDGLEIPVDDDFYLSLRAERTSGTSNLDVDYLILVPADDRFTKVVWVEAGPSYWKLNARDNSAAAYNASDQLATAARPEVRTALPMLTPNQTNRLYMIYEVGLGLATTLTTVTVTVSYHPKYLTVRPAST